MESRDPTYYGEMAEKKRDVTDVANFAFEQLVHQLVEKQHSKHLDEIRVATRRLVNEVKEEYKG